MKPIKSGTKIPLSNGSTAIVKSLLGEGGQGAVYFANIDGKDYALKIYAKRPSKKFSQNLWIIYKRAHHQNISYGRSGQSIVPSTQAM